MPAPRRRMPTPAAPLGGEHSRFLGVPISIKDLADTAGIVSTHGTAEWRDRVPEHDDAVIAKIRAAGFVFLGKTVVPEFGPLNISEPPGLPAGAQPVEPRPQLWRFVRWGRRGPGVGDVPDLARLRRRRLDPQPVVVVRRVRPEAAARPHLARAEPAEHVLARRSDHADGCRRGRAARRDGGLRHRRRVVGAAAGAPLPRRSGRRPGEAPRRVPSRTPAFRATSARRPTARPQRTPRSCSPTSATRSKRRCRRATATRSRRARR